MEMQASMCRSSVGTRELMDAAVDARLWVVVGTGLEHVDVPYLRERGFMVTYCPGPMSAVALAECAMMFMGMLVRQYKRTQEFFQQRVRYAPTVGDLEGMSLLILGFGPAAVPWPDGRRRSTCRCGGSMCDR